MNDEHDVASRLIGLTPEEAARVASEEGLRLRVIEPDRAYTMEYAEDRINVTLDAAGRVETARRG
ncbi:MAG: I78 family peptidase inhibitor [Frankiaceae bacterium]